MKLQSIVLNYFNLAESENTHFEYLGLSNSLQKNTLSFCISEKYVSEINNNPNILGVITSNNLADYFINKFVVISEDPSYDFINLYNLFNSSLADDLPTSINKDSFIDQSVQISNKNVKIGKGVTIGPNTSILSNVSIGDNCIIGSNTVIGCDDIEAKMTKKGLINVYHEGGVIIENNCRIGSSSTIVKGIYGRDTIIRSNTFISNNCHIGHAVHIGSSCLILSCHICGTSTIGNSVRLSPGCIISNKITIGDGAFVTLGSIVIKDVPNGEKVSGHYAINHNKYLYKYTKIFGRV